MNLSVSYLTSMHVAKREVIEHFEFDWWEAPISHTSLSKFYITKWLSHTISWSPKTATIILNIDVKLVSSDA